jgi:hypothetical protein
MNDYIEAQRNLDELLNEERSLSTNLSAAFAAGDALEMTRLKCRKRDLPNEIFTAKAMLYKAHLEMLEAEQAADYREMLEAKQKSKNLDSIVSAKMQVLDTEKGRLLDESLTALALPSTIGNRISRRSAEISKIKNELSELVAA